jgi:hypothetical protein
MQAGFEVVMKAIRRVTFPSEMITECREIAALEHRTAAQYIRRAVEKQLRLDRRKLGKSVRADEKP